MKVEERLKKYLSAVPKVDATAYVASQATVIGTVVLGPRSSVWPNVVLRGDINSIEIGEGTNIQDGTVVHLSDDFGVRIGSHVTVGHLAMIHACTIGDECLIGMKATILDGAEIGEQSIIGAGALVTKGARVPPRSLVLGMPGKVVRALTDAEVASLRASAEKYIAVAAAHKMKFSSGRDDRNAADSRG